MPTGLTCKKEDGWRGVVRGTPTKAGAFKVTVSAKFGKTTRKAIRTVLVQGGESSYLKVALERGNESRGTVTGSGVYSEGTTVKLSAKAAKGYIFAGWYSDEGCSWPLEGGKSGEWRTANETLVFGADSPREIYARFVSTDEDRGIEIVADNAWDCHSDGTEVDEVRLKLLRDRGGCHQGRNIYGDAEGQTRFGDRDGNVHGDCRSASGKMVGTFTGVMLDAYTDRLVGVWSMTRTSVGKQTVSYQVVNGTKKTITQNYWRDDCAAGMFDDGEDGSDFQYEIDCPYCRPALVCGSVTCTVGQNGTVKLAGKIDGESVSGSSLMLIEQDGANVARAVMIVGSKAGSRRIIDLTVGLYYGDFMALSGSITHENQVR